MKNLKLESLRSEKCKKLASSLGFEFCGISRATRLQEEEQALENWLNKGYQGKMQWMENHFDKRVDPRELVPGAKTVISLLFNYYPPDDYDSSPLRISKYAYGTDYHFVIKDKLKSLMQQLQEELGEFQGRVFVDSAPVLDRAWAARSGLGWIGKNAMLINKTGGSFYFIAELIIDMEMQADMPHTDHCGTCTACIDACPTDAIVADKVIDSNKCISYLTIELKENIPTAFKNQMEGWIFGCDICQDVCPWNRFSVPHEEPTFKPPPELEKLHKSEWKELTEEVFRDVFKKSALKRAGYIKLKSSIEYLNQSNHLGT